jgi:muconolactone D-isomerase
MIIVMQRHDRLVADFEACSRELTGRALDAVTTDQRRGGPMEFLVEFTVAVPSGIPQVELERRSNDEAAAAGKLADDGHLVRLWLASAEPGKTRALGIYRADDRARLDGLLAALPLHDWMQIAVTPLQPHPNDPPRTTPHQVLQDGEPIAMSDCVKEGAR